MLHTTSDDDVCCLWGFMNFNWINLGFKVSCALGSIGCHARHCGLGDVDVTKQNTLLIWNIHLKIVAQEIIRGDQIYCSHNIFL
jgi:hypothetical protein